MKIVKEKLKKNLELKHTTEMKNSLIGLIGFWRWQEKRISKFEDRLIESIQSEEIREMRLRKN